MKRIILKIISALSMMMLVSCSTNRTHNPENPPTKTSEVKMEINTNDGNIDIPKDKPADNLSAPKMKTYSNNLYSVSYPSDWLCAEHPNDFVDVAFGQQVGIAFSIFHVDIENPLKEIVESGNRDMKSQLGATVLSNNNIKLCNVDAYKTVFSLRANGIDCKQISYTLKKGVTYYNVRFNGGVKDMDKNAELIETIIQSFELKTK
jgi:hypothetical protein